MTDLTESIKEKIARLEMYSKLLRSYSSGRRTSLRRVMIHDPAEDERAVLRSQINKETHWVRQCVIEAGYFQTVTIGPPPAIGGVIASNIDPFGAMFNPPYGKDLFPFIIDMIDRTIGVISTQPDEKVKTAPTVQLGLRKNFAFVAMAIDGDNPELADVLDSIKESANRCGIQAERIDEEQSNERITDRILESIRVAEHVIVDLTGERPNVFFEAGYAHGLGKIPIYIAKAGTKIHFDLKDYPIIFFKSFRQLKDELETRLHVISGKS